MFGYRHHRLFGRTKPYRSRPAPIRGPWLDRSRECYAGEKTPQLVLSSSMAERMWIQELLLLNIMGSLSLVCSTSSKATLCISRSTYILIITALFFSWGIICSSHAVPRRQVTRTWGIRQHIIPGAQTRLRIWPRLNLNCGVTRQSISRCFLSGHIDTEYMWHGSITVYVLVRPWYGPSGYIRVSVEMRSTRLINNFHPHYQHLSVANDTNY